MNEDYSEKLMDAIAKLRDEHLDIDSVNEHYGHDITSEVISCPISSLLYTGDYIELLEKQKKELEEQNERLIKTLNYYADESIYDAQYKLDIMRDTGKYARKTLKEIKE